MRNYYAQRGYGQNALKNEKPLSPADDALTAMPQNPTVTMAYVPMQTDTTVYDTKKALREGTLFPVLNKPFAGAGDRR